MLQQYIKNSHCFPVFKYQKSGHRVKWDHFRQKHGGQALQSATKRRIKNTAGKPSRNTNDMRIYFCFIMVIENSLSQIHSNRINFRISTIYTRFANLLQFPLNNQRLLKYPNCRVRNTPRIEEANEKIISYP